MNILLYSNFFWPSIGGVEVVTRNTARSLVKYKHRVSVLTSTKLPEGVCDLTEGYEITRGIRLDALFKLIKNADLVICIGGISRKACLVSAIVNTPCIVWYQMLNTEDAAWWQDKLDYLLKRTVAGFLACSKACLDSHSVQHARRCLGHIYNPVSEDLLTRAEAFAEVGEPGKEIDVLFVGRLIRGKGIFVLCDALELLIKRGITPQVAFVGLGSDEDELLHRIEYLNALSPHNHIAFLGRKEGAALASVYQKSRILVIPTSSHPEGMGIVIAEAVTFGLPVIGSSQPAIAEVIADAGLVFRNFDASDLAGKIASLLGSDALYQAMSARAQERAREFHIHQFEKKLLATLQLQ